MRSQSCLEERVYHADADAAALSRDKAESILEAKVLEEELDEVSLEHGMRPSKVFERRSCHSFVPEPTVLHRIDCSWQNRNPLTDCWQGWSWPLQRQYGRMLGRHQRDHCCWLLDRDSWYRGSWRPHSSDLKVCRRDSWIRGKSQTVRWEEEKRRWWWVHYWDLHGINRQGKGTLPILDSDHWIQKVPLHYFKRQNEMISTRVILLLFHPYQQHMHPRSFAPCILCFSLHFVSMHPLAMLREEHNGKESSQNQSHLPFLG